jgi:hypothetical protein
VKRPHGQIRQSQVVTTFGPGSLLDLPRHSVLVSGLDYWPVGAEIGEPRLVEKVKRLLQLPQLRLCTPPPDDTSPGAPPTGIQAWQFPEWFIAQDVREERRRPDVRSRPLIHRTALTKGRYVDTEKVARPVVPVRFVRGCRRGHLGDIDWYLFVHGPKATCRRLLRMEERGTSGDLGEVWVRCECGAERAMTDAANPDRRALGMCDGARPWLGPYTKEACAESNRMLIRTASNSYFPQLMSVISLPDRDAAIARAVGQVWEAYLQYVDTLEELRVERTKKPPVKQALEGFTDEEVLAEIQARKGVGDGGPPKSVKQAEFEILAAAREELGNDQPDGVFYARGLPRETWDRPWMAPLDRVVLVHRLREVVTQVGFTRFEALAPDIEGELELGVERAALAREPSWLPAVENRGEGVFLAFRREAIQEWLRSPAVLSRGRQLDAGFQRWLAEHEGSRRQFPGVPYILVHSLAHLLITAVSLECGYPASSIRERVYAGAGGFGILLYTASPDAEGTLGGLVEAGRRVAQHLRAALELGELCSNDPVCAQHAPDDVNDRRFLLGAACHGCLLIAETSCEQHNDFLDRALVVPTVSERGTAFFPLER